MLMPTQGKYVDHEGSLTHAKVPHDIFHFGALSTWKTGTLMSRS